VSLLLLRNPIPVVRSYRAIDAVAICTLHMHFAYDLSLLQLSAEESTIALALTLHADGGHQPKGLLVVVLEVFLWFPTALALRCHGICIAGRCGALRP
jgi:hypothetical protein